MEINKQINKQFGVLAGEKDDRGLTAYASVEIVDTMGDLVKIDGITTENYHNPPTKHIKITPQHMMELSNGEPPIVGRVERFYRTECVDPTGKKVPALAFYFTWATEDDGVDQENKPKTKITDLALKYKKLYDTGYLDSFSVGLMVSDYQENEFGGFTFNKSDLNHISCVTIPANSMATVIRGLDETTSKTLKQIEQNLTKTDEAIYKLCNQVETLIRRFDSFESHFAVVSKSGSQTNSHKSEPVKNKLSPNEIKALHEEIGKLRKVAGK